jgi:endogenous inhibitor of DNA gyrase (YacG/DUF329 family)
MTCPICGKEPADKYKPFCSRRWLKGSYVIPGPAVEDDSSSDAEGSPPSRPQ